MGKLFQDKFYLPRYLGHRFRDMSDILNVPLVVLDYIHGVVTLKQIEVKTKHSF